MDVNTQSVGKTVSAMATVLADYLKPEEVALLTTPWRNHSMVSVKMLQQCVLDTTRRYPQLKAHRFEIRRGFWNTLEVDNNLSIKRSIPAPKITEQKSSFETTQAFYTVMEAFSSQVSAPYNRDFFHALHQIVAKERTFRGLDIDINQFLEGNRPIVPDDVYILNNMVQLAYSCLCEIVGPVEADDILFRVSEVAKSKHPRIVVEQLF